MKKATIFTFWAIIVLCAYYGLAQAEPQIDRTVHMKLLSYDFNESWTWGSYHESQNLVEAYTDMPESISRQVITNREKWIKVLFRIRLLIEDDEENDVATVIRVNDFKVGNTNLLIFPRYTRLSESGDDIIEVFPGKEHEFNIYVEAIALFENQNLALLNKKIQDMAFWCSVEYQPDTIFRHKKQIKIDTVSVKREIKFNQSGVKAEIKSIKCINNTEDYQDIIEKPLNPDKDQSVYEIVIHYQKSMPYAMYCLQVISVYDFIQVLPLEDVQNPNIYDTFYDKEANSMRIVCIYTKNKENSLDDELTLLKKGFMLEFSTEFFGLNNMDGTPANGAYGIRFQVPVF